MSSQLVGITADRTNQFSRTTRSEIKMATSMSVSLQVSTNELAGGVGNLRRVESKSSECRLLHVKGRRNIRVEQVRREKSLVVNS